MEESCRRVLAVAALIAAPGVAQAQRAFDLLSPETVAVAGDLRVIGVDGETSWLDRCYGRTRLDTGLQRRGFRIGPQAVEGGRRAGAFAGHDRTYPDGVPAGRPAVGRYALPLGPCHGDAQLRARLGQRPRRSVRHHPPGKLAGARPAGARLGADRRRTARCGNAYFRADRGTAYRQRPDGAARGRARPPAGSGSGPAGAQNSYLKQLFTSGR